MKRLGITAVECCVVHTCYVGVFSMFPVMYGRRLFSSVLALTERKDMGLYEVPLFMSLLGMGMGAMLSQLPYVRYYVIVESSFTYAGEECEFKRAYVV